MEKISKTSAAIISIRVSESMKRELTALASADDRTISNYVLRLLRDHLKKKGKKVDI